MPNLRIVYNNAADRNDSIGASTTAGSLAVTNLLTDIKSEVWRSTGTSATITLTWTAAELVSCVALPFCSLTSSATIRVRGYTNVADGSPAVDSGSVVASPTSVGYSADLDVGPLGVNNYGYGGSTSAMVYIAQTSVKKVVIDIVDTTNPLGYVEASRLVVGPYWTPARNAENGSVKVGMGETSKHERSDAGDLRTDRGVIYKTLSFNLDVMEQADRDRVWRIIRGNGMYRPMFLSLTPANTDKMEEQIFCLYGKLSKQSEIQYVLMNQFATTLAFEEL